MCNPGGGVGGVSSAGRLGVGRALEAQTSLSFLVEDDVEELLQGCGVDAISHRVGQH